MGSKNLDISRFEVTGVYTHPDAKVDVVLVHGLNGDPKKTWTAKNGVFWPADLLPASLKDRQANVLVYGYNGDVYSRSNDHSASDNFIFQHAQTLVAHLTTYRKSEGSMTRPIIWVAHSLGGILVKRALLYSNDVRATFHEELRSIYVSTYAIIFLGTPHTGSGLATWGHVLQAMSDAVVPKKFFESESVLLKTLKRDNERLQEINNHFLDIYQRFKIHMAHENHKTDLKGTRALVVDADSASPQLPGVTYYAIEATHSGMCKFEGVNSPGYRTIATAIRDWVEEAPQVIEVRWAVEEEDRQARARHEIDERRMPFLTSASPHAGLLQAVDINNEMPSLPPATVPPLLPPSSPQQDGATVPPQALPDTAPTSPVPLAAIPARPELVTQSNSEIIRNDPLFLHPERFRPNSYFIGREEELKELHKKLTDKKRRADGTSAVLVQCLHGGGKTHLARQYVFEHRAHYPGGIYWVRAKSITEMEQFYWKIAKNEALRDSVEAMIRTDQNPKDLCDPKNVVDIVRRWFNSFDEWLLVFDGIRFDMPGISRFIPDAENTSIIYTSTERSVTGDYEFDNPQIMELGLLSAPEAQELLLLEMEKKQPWTQDDRSRALELVQLMGRLPLMIHVAAQHLKATREPLSKYLRAYRTRPRVGSLPAYRAVWHELKSRGANPALNLMSILVFFDSWVPVGLLMLGLGALDNRTPVMTRDASHRVRSLNNSLKILIAFALVERTESDSISPTSSRTSSRKSFDRSAEYVDILRIHSVVQAFFMEMLAKEKEQHFWLERSTRVFCRSFDEAHKMIGDDPKVGLPDDYRRFAIHGRRLLEHLHSHEKETGAPQYLYEARVDVEARLSRIQEAVDRLSQATQAHIVSGYPYGEIAPASVFERASSLSETDSATPSSHRSLTATGTGLGAATADENWVPVGDDDDTVQYQSPATYYHPHEVVNPYHWHIPYPQQENTMPGPRFQGDDDDRTVVQTPQLGVDTAVRNPRQGSQYLESPQDDWSMAAAHHRTVRKYEDRRYHDRAGAWRDWTVGDPRISVSREIAKGSVFRPRSTASSQSRSPSRTRLTAESEAELTLNKIKAAQLSSSPRDGGCSIQDKGRAFSSSSLGARPRAILGRNSYADAFASNTPWQETVMSPAEFSNGFAKSMSRSPPSSWTAATLKRLKENIMPARAKTNSQADQRVFVPGPAEEARRPVLVPIPVAVPVPVEMPISSAHSSPAPRDDEQPVLAGSSASLPPAPLFRGSRSANSSPGQVNSPFRPPSPLLREVNNTSSLRRDLPASVRQWQTQVYHSGRGHLDSSDLGHGLTTVDPMTLSYPFIGPSGNHTINVHPPAGPSRSRPQPQPRVQGYTSEPMTRNPSAQLAPSDGKNNVSPDLGGAVVSGGDGVGEPRALGTHHPQQHSPPTGNSPHSLPSYVGVGQQPPVSIPQAHTPSSFVETEPSPFTGDAFPDVDTSYQRWEERHGQGSRTRRRAGSGSFFPFPRLGRVAGGRSATASSSDAQRSQSQSPSGNRRGGRRLMPMNFSSPHSSPPLPPAPGTPSSRAAVGSPRVGFAASAKSTSPGRQAATGEPMVRSGSGGIKLGDGRIVEFGQVVGGSSGAFRPAVQEAQWTAAPGGPPSPSPDDIDESSEYGAIGLGIGE